MSPAEARRRLQAALARRKAGTAGRNIAPEWLRVDRTPEQRAAAIADCQARIDANDGHIPRTGDEPDWFLELVYAGCTFRGVSTPGTSPHSTPQR